MRYVCGSDQSCTQLSVYGVQISPGYMDSDESSLISGKRIRGRFGVVLTRLLKVLWTYLLLWTHPCRLDR